MLLDLELKKCREINANITKVWHALINPEMIEKYLFGTKASSEWKTGAEILFEGEWEGTSYQDKGIIQTFIPNEHFAYSYWSNFSGLEDIPENYALVSFQLKALEGGRTELTLIQQKFASEEALMHSQKSWDMVLDQMIALLA